MMRILRLLAIPFTACLVVQVLPIANAQVAANATSVEFAKDVLPILQAKCFDCHGPDTRESQLRLDRRWAMLRGGNSGEPSIQPGNAEASYLIQLITHSDPDKRMPPEDSGESLSDSEIGILNRWITGGAKWPGPNGADQPSEKEIAADELNHWSFQPVVRPQLPSVPGSWPNEWTANPIDAFVSDRLAKKQLRPSSKADRATRIRRLYLDMLGLPPSPAIVRKFEADSSRKAWKLLVDDTLNSPHYGERWARYWLDLVRFAETDGFETNRERPNAWPYRDYVIRSLNDDKPFNRFITEQLAGDVVGVPEATAFLVAGAVDIVKSPDVALTLMQRQNELDDMVNTTSTVFFGLTVGCARCHNHKFDPIRQTDYYGMQAIFTGVRHGNRTLPPSDKQRQQRHDIGKQISELIDSLKPFLKRDSPARIAVTAAYNEEFFEPVEARYIRFTITATNGGQPCIDELEIFADDQNVALASTGAVPTCSSSLPGYDIHKLEHINDGKHGNEFSWISNENRGGWVQIELPVARLIDRIVWARDRNEKFGDRLATEYHIDVAVEAEQWTTVASSNDRQSFGNSYRPPKYSFEGISNREAERGKALLKSLQHAEAEHSRLRESTTVYAGNFETPQPTYRLFRGEPMAKREQVEPSAINVLGKLNITEETPEPQRRMALAQWIASPDNPLTARVIVNRIWQWHFGNGLVNTASDFGKAGIQPTHPELLDWLASELIDNNWSIKHIHRLILTSETYQQSSQPNDASMTVDAGCQLWWRFPPRRLEAEPIRDSILSVTGLLDTRMYGPGFSGFQVELENVRHYFPKSNYSGDDFRRMIYMTKVRQEQESVFGIFDCPDAASSVPQRSRSTTPLQALNLMNSTFILEQSNAFAARLSKEPIASDQVRLAFWLCYAREATADEVAESALFINAEGLVAFCRAVLNSNEFLFIQ